MTPHDISSAHSIIPDQRSSAFETEVKIRILAWCSTWSSVKGQFQADRLREIATDGPMRMAADFGHDMAVSVTFDAYAAFWAPVLTRTLSEWLLLLDSPIEVTVGNSKASASFHARLQGTTHEGRRRDQRQHMLQIWENTSGTWHLAHEQMTVDPQGGFL